MPYFIYRLSQQILDTLINLNGYTNKIRIVHFDQQEAWGAPVKVAARVDLTGMNTQKLYFYGYTKTTNAYTQIKELEYWIDANGYLRFITPYAGDIIISENPLVLKKK